jgi:hypothetical protein
MARVRTVSFPRSFEVMSSPLVRSLQWIIANTSLAQHFGRKAKEPKARREAKKANRLSSEAKKWERGLKWLEENPGKRSCYSIVLNYQTKPYCIVDLRPRRRPKAIRELRKAAYAAMKVGKEKEKEMGETGEGRGGSPVGWGEEEKKEKKPDGNEGWRRGRGEERRKRGEICTIICAFVSVPSGLQIELFTLGHMKVLCLEFSSREVSST